MSLIHRLFNIYLGVPTALLGVFASFLSLGFFWNDSTTFLGTRILLFSVSVTDTGYLSLHSFYHLAENLIPDSTLTQVAIIQAVSFYALNVFELARNWLLVMVALERLLFFLRPNDFPQRWTATMFGAAETVVMVAVLLMGVPSLLFKLPNVSSSTERVYEMAHMLVNKAALKHSEICNETDGNAKHVMSILQMILVTFTAFAMPCFFSSALHFYCQFNQLCTSVAMDTLEDGVSSIANYFSIITSTSNFFIYILQSKGYRRRLIHMLHLQQYQWFRAHNDGGVK
ncbi:unnamed protein product [Taenia asiatica]|uniref:G_PROTEIN_RECEP_F1_2 domain-containing protein n=1 Tax=Taenia asiatica TaxID=60517 RepID=A0A0R3W258_TAEAS|nr:unnamed protein product [Taenia asiatica]